MDSIDGMECCSKSMKCSKTSMKSLRKSILSNVWFITKVKERFLFIYHTEWVDSSLAVFHLKYKDCITLILLANSSVVSIFTWSTINWSSILTQEKATLLLLLQLLSSLINRKLGKTRIYWNRLISNIFWLLNSISNVQPMELSNWKCLFNSLRSKITLKSLKGIPEHRVVLRMDRCSISILEAK